MIPRPLLYGCAALMLSTAAAAAQTAGGIGLVSAGGTSGIVPGVPLQPRMPVFVDRTPRGAPPGAMVTNPNVSRRAVHQQAITRVRGDAGYLAGFHQGTPLAASRQPPPPLLVPNFTFIDAPFIVNNFNSALNFAFEGGTADQQIASPGGEIDPGANPVPDPVDAPVTPPPGVAGEPDPAMRTLGPLTHLPFALATPGGVSFNNVNSTINVAAGTGNSAVQNVFGVQR